MALKIRNILFCCVCCCILSTTIICKFAVMAGGSFPEWFQFNTNRSLLEGRLLNDFPTINAHKVLNGQFQDEFESYVNELPPMRDSLLLVDSASQRATISAAASFFGYDVYPTYFDSDFVYNETNDTIYPRPKAEDAILTDQLLKASVAINELVASRSSHNYYFALVPKNQPLAFKPLSDLNSSTIDYTYSNFLDSLDADIRKVDLSVSSLEDYNNKYFRTDHHWNIDGGYDAYAKIANEMGFGSELIEKGEALVYDEIKFYGYSSRHGKDIDMASDVIRDYIFDLPELDIWFDHEKVDYSSLADINKYQSGEAPKEITADHYGEYFHNDYSEIRIEAKNTDNERNLLIIGDSYTNCIERLFTEHYGKVHVYDPRYSSINIYEFIDKYNGEYDDILFLSSELVYGDGNTLANLSK